MKKYLIGSAAVLLLLVWTGWGVAGEEADHVCFRLVDADDDGKVSPKEFAEHYGDDSDTFKAIDTNADGHLTHDEYHDFLGDGAEGQKAEK